jgi:hypothetical protein
MEKTYFYVGDRPHAVWDPDIREKNLRFLKGFDTKYFEYLADVHSAQMNTDADQQAAIALRTSYGLALETFFSLLGAALQAPNCVFGWLFKYKPTDLELAIKSIMGLEKVKTRFLGRLSWESLSRTVHLNLVLADKNKEHEIKTRFAKCWEYLAKSYLDVELRNEFNSTKHGLRLQPGGIHVAFGLQERPDVPAPPERMQSMGGSDFGSTVLKIERIGKPKHDYRILENSKNWDLSCLTGRIRMISMSIGNVISFLLIQNGQDPTQARFVWPEDLENFNKIWEPGYGLQGGTFGFRITEEDICPTKAEDIEKSYSREKMDSEGD